MDLCDRIRNVRQALSMTQTEFANRLGTSQKIISRWESGTQPRGNVLEKIAELGNVSFAWLATGIGESGQGAELTEEEVGLLARYREIEDRQERLEILGRAKYISRSNRAKRVLLTRARVIFTEYGKGSEVLRGIQEYVSRRMHGYYEELIEMEAIRSWLKAEDVGYGDVDDDLKRVQQQIGQVEAKIEGLGKFSRQTAIEIISGFAEGEKEAANLLKQLKSGS